MMVQSRYNVTILSILLKRIETSLQRFNTISKDYDQLYNFLQINLCETIIIRINYRNICITYTYIH